MTLDAAQHDPAKARGTRISRWPRGWSRAAPPADPGLLRIRPDRRRHRRPRDAARGRQARASRRPGGKPARPRRQQRRRRDAARGAAERNLSPQHAQDLLAAFRQDVTKHRYARLGRPDRLLPLFGDAGRPLRARRAWREPLDLARLGQCLRRAADHQSPAGLREGLPHSTASISRSMRWRRRAPSVEALARRARRRNCSLPARTCRAHRRMLERARPARRRSRTRGWRWRSPPSSRWRGISCTCCGTGIR